MWFSVVIEITCDLYGTCDILSCASKDKFVIFHCQGYSKTASVLKNTFVGKCCVDVKVKDNEGIKANINLKILLQCHLYILLPSLLQDGS